MTTLREPRLMRKLAVLGLLVVALVGSLMVAPATATPCQENETFYYDANCTNIIGNKWVTCAGVTWYGTYPTFNWVRFWGGCCNCTACNDDGLVEYHGTCA